MSYESDLEEWKRRNGIEDARDGNHEEMAMLSEEKASKHSTHCLGCDVEFPVNQMKLITRGIDPYVQIDEGESDYIAKSNRVRMCEGCFKERYNCQENT